MLVIWNQNSTSKREAPKFLQLQNIIQSLNVIQKIQLLLKIFVITIKNAQSTNHTTFDVYLSAINGPFIWAHSIANPTSLGLLKIKFKWGI